MPQASILLLTFNQESYVREALTSLLNQDLEDLEIVVSDDCSSDRTWAVVQDVANKYEGSKTLVLHRNDTNIGIVGNYYKAFSLSHGGVIFTAAGDDTSVLNRCSTSIEFWHKHGEPDLVAADAFDMALDGQILGVKEVASLESWNVARWMIERPYMFGASFMMTRRLLELRPLNPKLSVEDQVLICRALMMGGAVHLPQALVNHRRGGVSQLQNKRRNYDTRKADYIKSAQMSLLEIDEIALDANILAQDFSEEVKVGRSLHQYILRVLESQNIFKRGEVFFEAKNIPLSKRLRYFLFAQFSGIYRLIYSLKATLRS